MKSPRKPIKKAIAAAVIAMTAGNVNAGGFSLYTEGNGEAVGNFGAGLAAEAADASIGWYNPAGLVLIRNREAVIGGVGIFPSSRLDGIATFTTAGIPPYVQVFEGLQGAENAFVPSLHFAQPVGERATLGLSVVSPFGLSTEWSDISPVRYAATRTELMTITISPEIGGLLTDQISIGGGIDLQWASVKFNQILGSPAMLQAALAPPMLWDSWSDNRGHSFGVGFHAGILGMFNDSHTRIGLNYQSRIKHKFQGRSQLTGVLADPALLAPETFRNDNLFSNNAELPDIVTLSGYHDVNDKLAVLASVVYTGWDVFKVVQLNNVAARSPAGLASIRSTSVEDYKDTWRGAIGVNYHVNDFWMIRAGAGYDQTPTVNTERDVRLPDASRWAVAIGSHLQLQENIGVDFGYTHLFAANTPTVNKTTVAGTTSTFNVNAQGHASANLVGGQIVWKMDQVKAPTK